MLTNPLTAMADRLRDRRRSDEGFTLIELLVVVVILGILIGIAIPVYLNYRKSANDKAAQSDLRNAISTLEVCYSDGGYPTAVNTTTGALTGCTSQGTVKLSSGTTVKYVGTTASYVMTSQNSGGTTTRWYCYASTTGGSVTTRTTEISDTATAC